VSVRRNRALFLPSAAALGALGMLVGMAIAFTPADAPAQLAPEVRDLVFAGNDTFARDSLERAIRTTQTECRSWVFWFPLPACLFDAGFARRRAELNERELPRDVARLEIWYQRRGFREVQVEATTLEREDGGVEVRFAIEEGRPVLTDSLAFLGVDQVGVPGLLDGLPIRAGDRWSTLGLDATRDTLVRRLRNRGYPYADVLRQSMFPAGQPYQAHVTFEVAAGTRARYGDIQVLGNVGLSDSTILKTLPFRSGDPYRLDQLADGQARLFGLEMVTSASVAPDLGPQNDSIIPLLVRVQEGDPYRVRVGVGHSSAECLNAEARWTSRNFRGGGRVLQLRGRLSNVLTHQFRELLCWQGGEGAYADLTWVAAVDFSQPWIFSTRNSFNASLFAERQSVPGIFVRRAVGVQLAIVRAVGPRTPLTLSYRPELSSLSAAQTLLCTGLLVCRREDIDFLTSAQRLAPLGLNLTRDLSNSLLNPTSGYRLIVDLEHAAGWTWSEYRYDRAVLEGTWYSGLNATSVLATRIRGGWVGSTAGDEATDIVPPQKRFYAGGANSVRGFGQSRLGPRVLVVGPSALVADTLEGGAGCTVAEVVDLSCDASGVGGLDSRATGGTRVLEGNLELRFALARDFEAVTFADFGQVWGPDQTVDMTDLEFTPGIGFRYLSPVGPIRVDLGYSFRGSEPLPVLTERIQPSGTAPVGFVGTGDLTVLDPRVDYSETESRFQLHISIGQAF
jgi:outer membrane protein insertion porin family/translocation and assembly module TamA